MNSLVGTIQAPLDRESSQYRCTSCGNVSGWHGMLTRNGIRNNCTGCLRGRALVGTMERIAAPSNTEGADK